MPELTGIFLLSGQNAHEFQTSPACATAALKPPASGRALKAGGGNLP